MNLDIRDHNGLEHSLNVKKNNDVNKNYTKPKVSHEK